jgi:heparin/heparan-sulfate lyase
LNDKKIPAALIVFDKVVSSNPGFQKFWLLHSIEEPVVDGNRMIIKRTKNGDSGMLVNTVLIPQPSNASIQAIGGKGKESWVFGQNYPNIPAADDANERGEWRIEISPRQKAQEDYYLNVMQITDHSQKEFHKAVLIENETVNGVQLADRVVTFSKNSNKINRPFSLIIRGDATYKLLITDLTQGTWQIMKDGKVVKPALYVRSDDGILYFEGTAGEYKFLR